MRHLPVAAVAFALSLVALAGGCGAKESAPTGEVREGISAGSCDPGDPACSCVEVQPASYDTSCQADSDCVAISAGKLCGAGSCFAANAAINADSYDAYVKDRQPVEYAGCLSATTGTVACVNQLCVIEVAPSTGSSSGSGASGGSGGSGDMGSKGSSGGSSGAGSGGTGLVIDFGDDDDTSSTAGGDDSSGSSGSTSSSGDDDDDDDDKHESESEAKDAGSRARKAGTSTLR